MNNITNSCNICYSYEENLIKCTNVLCTSSICKDCFESYLNFCKNEKKLVKCINQYCKSYILYYSFNKYFPKEIKKLYSETLKLAFINSNGDEVNNDIIYSNIIKKIREEKLEYIKTLPKAINLLVNISLKDKLDKIIKNNKEFINITKSNRLCMINKCNGKLSKDLVCLSCDTSFCKKCEKIIIEDHKCSNDDIESLKFISDIVKCPNCNISIEKSDGCNGMTCASCKQIFDYSTGESGDHGSYNEVIGVIKTKRYFDFKQNYNNEISKKLFIIENKEPREANKTTLNNFIKKIIIDIKQVSDDEIINSFEKYIIDKINYSNYMTITTDIIETHNSSLLNEDYVNKVLLNISKRIGF